MGLPNIHAAKSSIFDVSLLSKLPKALEIMSMLCSLCFCSYAFCYTPLFQGKTIGCYNAQQVKTNLEYIYSSENPEMFSFINNQLDAESSGNLTITLDQMTPSIYGLISLVQQDITNFIFDEVFSDKKLCLYIKEKNHDNIYSFWLTPLYSFMNGGSTAYVIDSLPNCIDGVHGNNSGFLVGLERQGHQNVLFGVMTGYYYSNIENYQVGGRGNLNTALLGPYLKYEPGNFSLDFSLLGDSSIHEKDNRP